MEDPALTDGLRIGSCSWKFDSWKGLVYSGAPPSHYLAEYARQFNTVEIDQWYWSLFAPDRVLLPKPQVVAEYARAVPDGFKFGIKMPNAITLTHFRQEGKTDPAVANPHFLSWDLTRAFLDLIEPLSANLGPLMFQFSYLNRQMMASQAEFLDRLDQLVSRLPSGLVWGIETRNPNYLNDSYFAFLREHGLAQVWEMGYYMPPVFKTYAAFAEQLSDDVIVRLHGPDWQGMDRRAGKDWSGIIEPRDDDLDALARMLKDIKSRKKQAWAFVNNHFEGCAPQTIRRIRERLSMEDR